MNKLYLVKAHDSGRCWDHKIRWLVVAIDEESAIDKCKDSYHYSYEAEQIKMEDCMKPKKVCDEYWDK